MPNPAIVKEGQNNSDGDAEGEDDDYDGEDEYDSDNSGDHVAGYDIAELASKKIDMIGRLMEQLQVDDDPSMIYH